MAIPRFAFDPPNGWEDTTVFPTFEADETNVRADYQRLHAQTRDYINNELLQAVDDAIDEAEAYVDEAVSGVTGRTMTGADEYTLDADGWTDDEQTISVDGVTANSVVVVSPAPADAGKYMSAGILATALGSGTVTFSRANAVSGDVTVNVTVFAPRT